MSRKHDGNEPKWTQRKRKYEKVKDVGPDCGGDSVHDPTGRSAQERHGQTW